jgi:hypothetical protein
MSPEKVIEISKEIGFSDEEIDNCQLMFVRFAHLVAQLERKRIATSIERLPFGDTAASFAIYVRELKDE